VAFTLQGQHHRGDQGSHGRPTFWPPFKKNGDIFKPRYVCTSDSSIHVNIAVVSTVLALDAILTDAKKKVWFSGHIPIHKLKALYSEHIPRRKVAMLIETRSTTIGLLLHA